MDEAERSDLIERYRRSAEDIDAVIAELGDGDLDRRPADPDGWSPREVVHHVADSEAMAYTRLRRLIADDDPLIQGYEEPVWARRLHYDRAIEPSVAVMHAVRAASLQLLEALTPDEWARTGRHTEMGSYSVEHWLRLYAAHPTDHANQIREVLAEAAR